MWYDCPQERPHPNKKRQIESYERVEESTMPSYEGELTDGELDDLVAYLFSLRRE